MAIELREARRGDELAVADLHVRTWQEAYRGLIPAEFLDALDPADRARTYTFEASDPAAPTTVLAVEAGEGGEETILGFTAFCPSRDADAHGLGEVDQVVLCACSPPYSHEDTVLLAGDGE